MPWPGRYHRAGYPLAGGELAAGGGVGQLPGVAEGTRQRRALGAAVGVVAGAGGDVAGVVEQLAGASLPIVAVPGAGAGGRVEGGQAVQPPQLVHRAGARAAAGGDRQDLGLPAREVLGVARGDAAAGLADQGAVAVVAVAAALGTAGAVPRLTRGWRRLRASLALALP